MDPPPPSPGLRTFLIELSTGLGQGGFTCPRCNAQMLTRPAVVDDAVSMLLDLVVQHSPATCTRPWQQGDNGPR